MTRLTHGMAKTRIYGIWRAMLSRCENPKTKAYPDYGGRGIYVCEEWHAFDAFYRDMGERPDGLSLDRIDNDGPYSPENCRWADRRTQTINSRRSRKITALGETKSLAEWSETTGLSMGTLWNRLKLGWSEHATVTTPKLRQRKAEHGIVWEEAA